MIKDTVFNMLPIATGGGLQNASSFLESLAVAGLDLQHSLVLLREDSSLIKICEASNIPFLKSTPKGNFGRLKFEVFGGKVFKNRLVCFTLFGPSVLSSLGRVINVVGCAYSNLFYPEIPFWRFSPIFRRAQNEAIDLARKHMTIKADYWIFETEALRKRAVEICGFPEDRVNVVRMAPSKLVSKDKVDSDQANKLDQLLPKAFRFLYLSGPHPNKRLHLLPGIAKEMIHQGFEDFCFVTTMNEASNYAQRVMGCFVDNGISKHISNLGPVSSTEVSTVIDVCDAMCTLSVLESFSNNFVEAWQMGKPLIVTDADWSRDSCGDAAIYVDPIQTKQTASAFISLIIDTHERTRLVKMGRLLLSLYNTPESKLAAYLNVISHAERMGPLSNTERNKIRWP